MLVHLIISIAFYSFINSSFNVLQMDEDKDYFDSSGHKPQLKLAST